MRKNQRNHRRSVLSVILTKITEITQKYTNHRNCVTLRFWPNHNNHIITDPTYIEKSLSEILCNFFGCVKHTSDKADHYFERNVHLIFFWDKKKHIQILFEVFCLIKIIVELSTLSHFSSVRDWSIDIFLFWCIFFFNSFISSFFIAIWKN